MKKKAFTLLELLIVVVTISVVAVVIYVALDPLTRFQEARDTTRIADIQQIRRALELYVTDNGNYPTLDQWNSGIIEATTTDGRVIVYLDPVPAAPTPPDGNCTVEQNNFIYNPAEDLASYNLSFCLGGQASNLTPGPKCVVGNGILDELCSGCLGVKTIQYAGGPFNSAGTLRDQGGYYRVAQIGNQCWLKDNMNAGAYVVNTSTAPCEAISITWSCQANDSIVEKYCYGNNIINCDTYGGMYEWPETMSLPNNCGYIGYNCNNNPNLCDASGTICDFPNPNVTPRQGICPYGWHVADRSDWDSLYSFIGSDVDKITLGSSNSTKFSLVPGGHRTYTGGGFGALGQNAYYHLPIPDTRSLYTNFLLIHNSFLFSNDDFRISGFSLRCIKD
jgi:uncharacterized protein (TIGR02145 family)/prepilin-type N-terminal cleavage/methylation domain-containing protein